MRITDTENACPNLNQFQQLASGQLSEIEAESLLAHLENCDACAQKMKTLPEPDTLVGMLRQSDTVAQETNKKAIAGLVERLSKLRPEQVPAGAKPQATTARAAKTDNTIDQPPADAAKKATYEFLALPQMPDELGRLGPYRVLEVLGIGGMGVVFRAEDPQLARMVALKAMLPGSMTSESARQRFLREAQAAAGIKHDHIVSIYQVGEDRGVLYLAMELLDGEPLDARLVRDGKLPVAEVLRIGRQIALGLAAAHKRGLIHRDIKPANIWLESETNRVKILDFGLARTTGEQAQLTQQGAIVGTPAYMAPEQGKNKNLDHRCDLFSLGCVLYRMATGEAPFRGTDVISTLMAVATETPRAPQVLEPALPKALSELIGSLLAKDAAHRPGSAQAVADALEGIALQITRPAPARKPRKWWPAVGIAAALAVVLIGLWAGGVIRVRTPDGVLLLDVNEPNAEVFVDGNQVTVTWDTDGKKAQISIKPGSRKVEVKKDGFTLYGEDVEVKDGDRRVFTAKLDRTPRPMHLLANEKNTPLPSAVLEALRREQIAPEALKLAGGGDPNKSPASLVGVLGEAVPLQTEKISRLAFSSDGCWLASASFDKTVFLRELSTGRVKRVFQGHAGPVSSVAFSKDGQTLASASHDGTIKLWPTDNEGEPQTLQPKCGAIWALAASSDGRFLAAGGANGAIKLWNWGKWDKPLDLPAHSGTVRDLAFSPDGEMLATARTGASAGADGHIRLYQTSDGKPAQAWVADEDKYSVHALAFHPNGKWLASTGQDRHIKLWEVASGKLLGERGDWTTWSTLAIHPNGKTLYACLAATNGVLLDLPAMKGSDGKGQKTGFFEYGVVCSAFSPDGKFLVAGDVTGVVHVWDTAKWEKVLPKQGHSHYVTALAINLDGRTVLSAGDDNALRRWDVGKPRESQLLHWFDRTLGEVASSPDGNKYVTTAGWVYFDADQRGCVWDAVTGKQLFKTAPPMGGAAAAVFSPDSKLFAGISHHSPCLHLWDANNGKELHRFPKNSAGLSAFSADSKLLAAAAGKLVKVWDVASGEELHSWEDDMPMGACTLSPDGQRFAAGHADGTISFWNLATKDRKKRTLAGHTARVNVLRFTPDGKTLVSASDDGTIRVWKPELERSLRELIQLGMAKYPSEYYAGLGPHGQAPHRRLVIELDPSGKYLFAAGAGPVIYVLRLPPGQASSE